MLLENFGRHVAPLDFSSLDAAIRECEALTRDGDVTFVMRYETHSLKSWLDRLLSLRDLADPFRLFLPTERGQHE